MESERFFGLYIASQTVIGQVFALLLATIVGAIIGYERERRGQPAGLRTHALVCVGAALIAIVSQGYGNGLAGRIQDSPARVAANVVVGIGFLGAGAIVREGMTIRGLTTAASIWVVAAMGMAIGTSPRLGEVACVCFLVVLTTLTLLNRFEQFLKIKGRILDIEISVVSSELTPDQLLAILQGQGMRILAFHLEKLAGVQENPIVQVRMRVRVPDSFELLSFQRFLVQQKGVVACSVE